MITTERVRQDRIRILQAFQQLDATGRWALADPQQLPYAGCSADLTDGGLLEYVKQDLRITKAGKAALALIDGKNQRPN